MKSFISVDVVWNEFDEWIRSIKNHQKLKTPDKVEVYVVELSSRYFAEIGTFDTVDKD